MLLGHIDNYILSIYFHNYIDQHETKDDKFENFRVEN